MDPEWTKIALVSANATVPVIVKVVAFGMRLQHEAAELLFPILPARSAARRGRKDGSPARIVVKIENKWYKT